jgi:hypothetical protein
MPAHAPKPTLAQTALIEIAYGNRRAALPLLEPGPRSG